MASDYAKKFYKSSSWARCRVAYLKSQNYICERCNIGAAAIVHHINYITSENIDNPEITLSWDNLSALCQDCHNREHHGSREDVTVEGIVFTADGQVMRAR